MPPWREALDRVPTRCGRESHVTAVTQHRGQRCTLCASSFTDMKHDSLETSSKGRLLRVGRALSPPLCPSRAEGLASVRVPSSPSRGLRPVSTSEIISVACLDARQTVAAPTSAATPYQTKHARGVHQSSVIAGDSPSSSLPLLECSVIAVECDQKICLPHVPGGSCLHISHMSKLGARKGVSLGCALPARLHVLVRALPIQVHRGTRKMALFILAVKIASHFLLRPPRVPQA